MELSAISQQNSIGFSIANQHVNHLKCDGTVGPVGEPQGAGDLLVEHNCTRKKSRKNKLKNSGDRTRQESERENEDEGGARNPLGAGSLHGNWSSGGSTSRRSQEAAMAAAAAVAAGR